MKTLIKFRTTTPRLFVLFALGGLVLSPKVSASGVEALLSNTIGYNNTATGFHALFSNTNGLSNVAMGFQALSNNTSGDGNIGLGSFAGANVNTAGGVICIGAPGANVDNSCYIGNIFGQTSFEGVGVFVNSDGKLGTSLSSRRFKKDIRTMDKASEAILALKPVTFHYKTDPKSTAQFGLIAEEVAEVNPDLVVRDKDGKPYSVRYDQVNAMLLNEFLKEHRRAEKQERKIQEQASTIVELKSEMKTLA